jgi:hypothetical protein
MGYSRCKGCKTKQASFKVNLVLYDVNSQGGFENRTMVSSGVVSLCTECVGKPPVTVRKLLFTQLENARGNFYEKTAKKVREQAVTTVNRRAGQGAHA